MDDLPIDVTPFVEMVQLPSGATHFRNTLDTPLYCHLTARYEGDERSPSLDSYPYVLLTTGYTRTFTLQPYGTYHYARLDVGFILCEVDNPS